MTRLKFIFIFYYIFFSFTLFADSIDSLMLEVKKSTNPEKKINLLLEIGDNYEFINADSSIFYYLKAQDLAMEFIEISDSMKILYIFSQRFIGFIYDDLGNYETSISYFKKSIDKINEFKVNASKQLNYYLDCQLSSSYSNLGSAYRSQGKYDKALYYYLKSIKIDEEYSHSSDTIVSKAARRGIGKSYNNLGVLQLSQDNHNAALNYFEKSIEYKKEFNDINGISACYNNIGVLYLGLKNYDKAFEYYNKALQIYKDQNDVKNINACYSNLANVLKFQKKYREAIIYFNKAISIDIDINDKSGLSIDYNNLSGLYNIIGNYNEAISYANKSLKIATEIGVLNEITVAYSHLVESYKGLKDYNKAFQFAELFIQSQDSLRNFEKTKTMAEMESRYQSEKKQQEIERQSLQLDKKTAEIKQQETLKIAYLIGFVMMILLAAAILRSFFAKKKANAILSEKNAEILQQKEEIQAQAEMLQEVNSELEKLSIIAQKTDNAIVIANQNTKIEWVNDAFYKLYGYKLEEFISTFGNTIIEASSNPLIKEFIEECLNKKQSVSYVSKNKNKDGKEIWVQTLITPLIEDNTVKKLIAIDSDITEQKNAEFEILEQRDTIAEQKKEITDSILYAENIQKAIMPSLSVLANSFTDYFIIYKPKNIVSGDFYWTRKIEGTAYCCVADCTGHGVPGAFMSMLGIALLNEISNSILSDNLKVNTILNKLRELLISSLNQSGKTTETMDGMDMSLIAIMPKIQSLKSQASNEELMHSNFEKRCTEPVEVGAQGIDNIFNAQWAGANNPLWIVRNAENLLDLEELKPDKMPIGLSDSLEKSFKLNEFELSKNDIIYLFSDGYSDQFGGPNGRKLMSRNFKNTISINSNKSLDEQKNEILSELHKWMNPATLENYEQIDDITILGIKI